MYEARATAGVLPRYAAVSAPARATARRLPERERAGLISLARRARLAAEAGLVHLVQHRNGPNDYNYLLFAQPRLEAARGTIAAIFAEVDA